MEKAKPPQFFTKISTFFHFFGEISERPIQLWKVESAVLGEHRRLQRHRAAVISRHLGKKRLKIDDSIAGMQAL